MWLLIILLNGMQFTGGSFNYASDCIAAEYTAVVEYPGAVAYCSEEFPPVVVTPPVVVVPPVVIGGRHHWHHGPRR